MVVNEVIFAFDFYTAGKYTSRWLLLVFYWIITRKNP